MNPSSIDAAAIELPLEGEPATGYVAVSRRDGIEVGVWEHGVGVSTDIETDEWFVVLSGDATVEFEGLRPDLELRPGILVHLEPGERTTWTVRTPLRKVYVTR